MTEASATKRREVQKAKTQLEQTGTPFLGVILISSIFILKSMAHMVVMGAMVLTVKNKFRE